MTQNNSVKFWIVTAATQRSTLNDILFESDPVGMMKQALGGLSVDEVLLVSYDPDYALSFAEEVLLRASEVK